MILKLILQFMNFDVYGGGILFLLGFGIVRTNYKNYTIELIPSKVKIFYDHCSCKNSKKQGGKRIEGVKRTFVERKNRKEPNKCKELKNYS